MLCKNKRIKLKTDRKVTKKVLIIKNVKCPLCFYIYIYFIKYYQRRHNNITTYKPTNMPGVKRKQCNCETLYFTNSIGYI